LLHSGIEQERRDVYIDWKILKDGELYTDFIISLNQFFEKKK